MCEFLSSTSNSSCFQPNVVKNVGMQQLPYCSSACLPLVSQSGLELKENICVDGQWRIEHCPPNYAIRCFVLQKTMRIKCKAKINLCKSICGKPTPCYLRFWVQFHTRSLEHHMHWFCLYDLNHCVGGTMQKYGC